MAGMALVPSGKFNPRRCSRADFLQCAMPHALHGACTNRVLPPAKKNGPQCGPFFFFPITRDDYWQTSTLKLSMYMPVGAVPPVLESVTARKRTCTDCPA